MGTGALEKLQGNLYDAGAGIINLGHSRFGLVEGGVVDNTPQINAALAEGPYGARWLLPRGRYRISGSGLLLQIDQELTGHGNASRLEYDGAGKAITVSSGIGANGRTKLKDFALTTLAGTPTHGIYVDTSTKVTIARVSVTRFPVQVEAYGCYGLHLHSLWLDSLDIADNTSTSINTKLGLKMTLCNSCTMDGQSLLYRLKFGAQLIACAGVTIADTNIEYGATPLAGAYGVKIEAQAGAISNGITLARLWVELHETGILLDGSTWGGAGKGVVGTTIDEVDFSRDTVTAWNAIDIVSARGTDIRAIRSFGASGLASVQVRAGADRTILHGDLSDFVVTENAAATKTTRTGAQGVFPEGIKVTGAVGAFTEGVMYKDPVNGMLLAGAAGSTNDWMIVRPSGAVVGRVPTGTSDALWDGHVKAEVVGKGFFVKEGANARMGVATLVAGTVTVNTTQVNANSRLKITRSTPGGTLGHLSYTKVNGTSFTVLSSSATDTSSFDWEITEAA